jgi:hypothetical protein
MADWVGRVASNWNVTQYPANSPLPDLYFTGAACSYKILTEPSSATKYAVNCLPGGVSLAMGHRALTLGTRRYVGHLRLR